MARPVRAAAVAANELLAQGLNESESSDEEYDCLSDEEEDLLDLELLNRVLSSSDEEESSTPSPCPPGGRRGNSRNTATKSYESDDVEPAVPRFKPKRVPGPHLEDHISRQKAANYTRAIDFFKLFFTCGILELICYNTNLYGWAHIKEKKSYARSLDGGWENVTVQELSNFLGLLIMMGFIWMPCADDYWSTATLFHGGWARRFLSRTRFRALMGMIHVSKPGKDDSTDKLAKIKPLVNHLKEMCKVLYQPHCNVSIDERMVRSKGLSGIRQFMPDKPVRFGFKLWCLCEAQTGYNIDFDIYTGRRQRPGKFGLAYDVVMDLVQSIREQSYHIFFDNFYTSAQLLKTLRDLSLYACGTTWRTRRGFPQELRDKQWEKKASRGDVRFVRKDDILFLQWKDARVVSMASTLHSGNTFIMAKRATKNKEGKYVPIMVKKPMVIHEYNAYMGGVDLADQRLANYEVRQKSHRWWKTLLFHCIDVAVYNSFVLFLQWQAADPEIPGLKRPAGYSHLSFRVELARQLANITDDEDIPTYNRRPQAHSYHLSPGLHMPQHTSFRRNCRLCYLTERKELKGKWKCRECDVYLCLTGERNCMSRCHDNYDHFYALNNE